MNSNIDNFHKFSVIVNDSFQQLNKVNLGLGANLVGNDLKNTIPLLYPTISRRHCALEVSTKLVFFDEASRNGSYLIRKNKKRKLPKKQRIALNHDDFLLIGPYKLQIVENNLEEIEIHNHGPFQEYFSSSLCQEIQANGFDELYVDLGQGLFRLKSKFSSQNTYLAWVQMLVDQAGRRLDAQNPITEGTLFDGSRIQAVLPPICQTSCAVSIRRFRASVSEHENTLNYDPAAISILKRWIRERKNFIISGGTGCGKTTLLNFLSQYISAQERIIIIEDTKELQLASQNSVQLQARKANADGVGEITLRQLLVTALRMRPDRIIVGECRGTEVFELIQAMNTGHPGSLSTIHANSTEDALNRIKLLLMLNHQSFSIESAEATVLQGLQGVVQISRQHRDGTRYISEILEVNKSEKIVLYSKNTF